MDSKNRGVLCRQVEAEPVGLEAMARLCFDARTFTISFAADQHPDGGHPFPSDIGTANSKMRPRLNDCTRVSGAGSWFRMRLFVFRAC